MPIALERKFLLHQLPREIENLKADFITQGYILKDKHREVRLRQKGMKFTLTVKDTSSNYLNEYESQISKKTFQDLWPATKGSRIEKERRLINQGDHPMEIYTYHGALSGLITAEVKFPQMAQASSFSLPEYFCEEITFNDLFRNGNLARLHSLDLKALIPLDSPGDYSLIGALPFLKEMDQLQIMLVTTRSNGSWIFPKGQPMPGKSNEETALIEAMEEAGIRGEIVGNPLNVTYAKSTGSAGMILYPMEITKVSKVWQEENERIRKLVTLEDAKKKLSQSGMKKALGYLKLLNL